MRAILTTLAVMAISVTAANANEMNRDPEGSIAQSSTTAAYQSDTSSSSMDAASISKMEPAAGTESGSAMKPARIAKYQPATKPVQSDDKYNHDDVEGTVVPSRMVE